MRGGTFPCVPKNEMELLLSTMRQHHLEIDKGPGPTAGGTYGRSRAGSYLGNISPRLSTSDMKAQRKLRPFVTHRTYAATIQGHLPVLHLRPLGLYGNRLYRSVHAGREVRRKIHLCSSGLVHQVLLLDTLPRGRLNDFMEMYGHGASSSPMLSPWPSYQNHRL
jgi:hypothetical protein